MLKLRHSKLWHLGKQNIFRFTTMSNRIDSSKPLPINAGFFGSKAKMHIEPHQDKIQPGRFPLDLIYSDVSGPYLPNCSMAKYYGIFLDNYNQSSKVVLLLSKDRVPSAFYLFWNCNEFGKACIWRFYTDRGREYDSYAFEDDCEEHGIIWEVTILGNPQINGVAERLGEILPSMASAMLKKSNFSMKYWSELILTFNYLCNWLPVVWDAIILSEAYTKYKSYL